MKKELGILFLSLIFGFIGALLFYLYAPLSWFDSSRIFGATITTIQGSDTLKDSRTTINTNFSNLNTDLVNLQATTSMSLVTALPGLTTAGSLATIGTITSGTWNGSTVGVAYGGTGSTTLSSNQILLGNGTTMLKTVTGYGVSGQFLTSQGSGNAPVWTSAAIDTAQNFTWSGTNTFNTATTTLNATTSIAAATNTAPLILNGAKYAFPAGSGAAGLAGASSSVLTTNGSGALVWATPDWQLHSATSFSGSASSSAITFPARKHVMIKFTSAGAADAAYTLNSDSSGIYFNLVATSSVFIGSTQYSGVKAIYPTNFGHAIVSSTLYIDNISGQTSTYEWTSIDKDGVRVYVNKGWGYYDSSTPITSITFGKWAGGTFGASVVDVYVSKD